MTLAQCRNVERLYYRNQFATYQFSDIDFTNFIQDQFEFGLDPLEFDLDDVDLYYYANSPSQKIYYFENLIANGEKDD